MKTITGKDIVARLTLDNPWWKGKTAFPSFYQEWKPRPYIDQFYPLVTNRKVRRAVVLMGPRRVGKTVMIHHVIHKLIDEDINPKNIFYISVDHPLYTGLALEQLLDFYHQASGVDYQTEECYVFFDEIQYLKKWENHLKSIVDTFPNIKCVVSGSAAAALKLKSDESGAGRFTDFLLPPLTFYEYINLLNKKHLIDNQDEFALVNTIDELNNHFIDYLNFGGYPEAIFSEEIRNDPGRYIKSDIIDKVLLRDLPSLYGISDVQELNSLFATLAFNTSNEISLEDLSQKSDVSKNTLKKYIEYLEAAFLIRVVHRIDKNAKRFKRVNTFKVYLTNPSMRSALYGPIDTENPAFGSIVETAMLSQFLHSGNFNPYYSRWKQGEIDLVFLDAKQKVDWALEIKWSDRYVENHRDLSHIIDFCHTHNLKDITITTQSISATIEIDNVNINFFATSIYCYAAGKTILQIKEKNILDYLKSIQ
jgi:uncharacterized protein